MTFQRLRVLSDFSHLKKVPTEDGSFTLYNENYSESCHSLQGPKQETITHYILGTKIDEKLDWPELKILEVGFGTGLGFLSTLEFLKQKDYAGKIIYTAFEMDEPTILWAIENHPELTDLKKQTSQYLLKRDNFTLRILLGNARESINTLIEQKKKYHCIYQDAFSPKRNPILWTSEWFIDLKKISDTDTLMSTYSSSSSIRKSMKQAGWSLQPGEKFGKKRSSTRANLQGLDDTEISDYLERSPVDGFSDKNIHLIHAPKKNNSNS